MTSATSLLAILQKALCYIASAKQACTSSAAPPSMALATVSAQLLRPPSTSQATADARPSRAKLAMPCEAALCSKSLWGHSCLFSSSVSFGIVEGSLPLGSKVQTVTELYSNSWRLKISKSHSHPWAGDLWAVWISLGSPSCISNFVQSCME